MQGGFKQKLFDQFALVGKALGNGNRLELLEFLAQGERSVETLSRLANLSIANASQHLRTLRQAGLVSAVKRGQHVFYSLKDEAIVELLGLVRSISEKNLAEVDRLVQTYLKVKDDLEPVPADELLERVKQGLVIVLDVRPPEEFASGHVPGAVNVPLKKLEERLDLLKQKKEVIAYCRGPYCVLAFDAVAKLREKGFSARRLEDGFPEWKKAGLPVETGPGESEVSGQS